MSSLSNRRAVAEVDFSGSEFSSIKVGNRSIHGFWHLLAPHFRQVLASPQRRPDNGCVAWTWSEPAASKPPTAGELAEVRRRLSAAQRSLESSLAGGDGEEGNSGGGDGHSRGARAHHHGQRSSKACSGKGWFTRPIRVPHGGWSDGAQLGLHGAGRAPISGCVCRKDRWSHPCRNGEACRCPRRAGRPEGGPGGGRGLGQGRKLSVYKHCRRILPHHRGWPERFSRGRDARDPGPGFRDGAGASRDRGGARPGPRRQSGRGNPWREPQTLGDRGRDRGYDGSVRPCLLLPAIGRRKAGHEQTLGHVELRDRARHRERRSLPGQGGSGPQLRSEVAPFGKGTRVRQHDRFRVRQAAQGDWCPRGTGSPSRKGAFVRRGGGWGGRSRRRSQATDRTASPRPAGGHSGSRVKRKPGEPGHCGGKKCRTGSAATPRRGTPDTKGAIAQPVSSEESPAPSTSAPVRDADPT